MEPQTQLILFNRPVPKQYEEGVKAMQTLAKDNQNCFLMINLWSGLHIDEICSYVSEWNLPTSLFVQYNNHTAILREIQHIKFPLLRKLFLRSNNIESIEILAQFDMPCLTAIWIGSNRVESLRSLRKTNFPHLEALTICVNRLQEMERISELHAPALKDLDLERSEDNNNSFSFRPFAKLQSRMVKNIWALKNRRIPEDTTYESLKRKYPTLHIYVPSN